MLPVFRKDYGDLATLRSLFKEGETLEILNHLQT